jgi:hypothetical protein
VKVNSQRVEVLLLLTTLMMGKPKTAVSQIVVNPAALELAYTLDNMGGDLFLYPGFIRGILPPGSQVGSFDQLKSRLATLPRGTQLRWGVFNLDSADKPFLFEDGQFSELETFCRVHGIELAVGLYGAETTKALVARVKEPEKDATDDLSRKVVAIQKLGQRRSKEAVPVLIDCLSDTRKEFGFRLIPENAAWALERITGQRFGVDQQRWRIWYRWPWLATLFFALTVGPFVGFRLRLRRA